MRVPTEKLARILKVLIEDLIKIREAITSLLAKIAPKSLEQLKQSVQQECRDPLTKTKTTTLLNQGNIWF